MKRFFVFAFVILTCTFCAPAQIKDNAIEVPRFKIYPTENIFNSLKLDTSTGRVWQVQIAVGEASTAIVEIVNNDIPTLDGQNVSDAVAGRFELYPTKNMFNFILIDTTDGRCWQVQWNTSEDKRGYFYLGN